MLYGWLSAGCADFRILGQREAHFVDFLDGDVCG